MAGYTYVDVEANTNSAMPANQVFKNLSEPFRAAFLRIFEGEPEGRLCAVTGWSSRNNGSPVDAYAVRVEDSSEGSAFLVYGGDWGLRLRPADSDAAWAHEDTTQWGEPYLVLSDAEDIVGAEQPPRGTGLEALREETKGVPKPGDAFRNSKGP